MILAVAILGLLALAATRWNEQAAGSIEGRAGVVDGDTLQLDGQRIRLRGIDAPELGQTCERHGETYDCGREARVQLARIIGGASVTCATYDRDRYDRLLGVCSVAGTSLNAEMVGIGWAVDYGGYADIERRARAAGAGLWAGRFDRPEEWRRARGDEVWPEGGLWHWLRTLFGAQGADRQEEETG